jgi:CheY-like chemotaxis protein
MLFKKRKKKILVADDDGDFLRVTQAILEYAGFAIDTVENGEDALKAIKKRKYDLLVLDVIMPRIDGLKLFRMVRKSKRYAKIPVLFISGLTGMEEMGEQQMEIIGKAEGYVEKPIKTKPFIELVKKLIEQ